MESVRKTKVSRGNLWKRKENTGVAREPIENAQKHTQMLRRNRLKTQRKQRCCLGTYRKQKENIGCALELMENKKKTNVLHADL